MLDGQTRVGLLQVGRVIKSFFLKLQVGQGGGLWNGDSFEYTRRADVSSKSYN